MRTISSLNGNIYCQTVRNYFLIIKTIFRNIVTDLTEKHNCIDSNLSKLKFEGYSRRLYA